MTATQRPADLTDSRRITGLERARRDRTAAALEAIRNRMPDLCDDRGQPCPFAVDAYLRLKGASAREVTPAAVREERRKRLEWLEREEPPLEEARPPTT